MPSIVIPAFNEENAIAQTITNLFSMFKNANIKEVEIVIVDDGSTDKTGEIAQNTGAKVIRHPHNGGYGQSLKSGIRAASFDTIVICDADGTYPIECIPDMLKEYEKGFDMVVGARQGAHFEESLKKKILRFILKYIVESTAGRNIPDINSGLRIFSKKKILPYFPRLCNTFSFTTSLTLAYMMNGKFVTYMPIPYHKRIGNTKVRLLKDAIRTMQFIIEASAFYNPLKIFTMFSICLIVVSGIGIGCSFLSKISAFYYLAIGTLLVSILMFGLGLIAVLLKQIMTKDYDA